MAQKERVMRSAGAALWKVLVPAFIGAAFAGLAACTTNPATGEEDFTPFMSPEEEARIGAEAHPQILKAYGGVYEDAEVGAYVAKVALRVARASDLPDIPYTVSVLDSPVVNAFALPGGYVYVTRGLLALANSEAELAGVLAHEIGHVAARHSAQRQTAAVGSQIFGTLLGAVVGSSAVNQLFNLGSQGLLASYSREQEFEADSLGVRYLARAGYDPYAQASFLKQLADETALAAKLANRDANAAQVDWLATHPANEARVREAARLAAETGVPHGAGEMNAAAHLRAVDGLLYGDRPEEGVIRGREFLHSGLGFRFKAPQDFHLQNTPAAVWAFGPDKSVVKFDTGEKAPRQEIADYLAGDWARQLRLSGLRRFEVGGLAAAEAWTRLQNMRTRIVAIEGRDGRVYRFLAGTAPQAGGTHDASIDGMVKSFRLLSKAEAARIKPLRIRTVKVQPGQNAALLAARMKVEAYALERFRVLNGLGEGGEPKPSSTVKLIAE